MYSSAGLEALSIARIAVLTALAIIITMIPAFSVVGVEGASITLGAMVPVLLGVLLMPREAIISAIIAGILSTIIPPPGTFGPFSPLPLIMATIAVVLVYRFKYKGLIGYLTLHLGLVVLFIIVSGMRFFEEFPLYPWFHIVGALIATLLLILKRTWLTLLISASIAGVLVDHIAGSVLAQVYFPLVAGFTIPGSIWSAITWIYPIERTILIVIACAILTVLYKIGVPAPWIKQ